MNHAFMKYHRYYSYIILLVFGALFPCLAQADIQVLGSESKMDGDSPVVYVHLLFTTSPASNRKGGGLKITLSNLVKNPNEKAEILENAKKTVVGFNASQVRLNYRINLIWCSDDGEYFIDENLNARLGVMLSNNKVPQVEKDFDEASLYLVKIKDNVLFIGSASGEKDGNFHFQVRVGGDGSLKFDPHSAEAD